MSGSKLKDIYDILNAIGTIAGDGTNIEDFIESLAGSSTGLNTLLADLNENVVQGFQNVVSAINDEALTNAWLPINQSLNYIGTSLMAYQSALGTVKAPTTPGGSYIITYNSDSIDFIDWCDGYTSSSGTVHTSKLDDMSSWLNAAPLVNSDLSLVGIFYRSSDAGTNAIDLIRKIAAAAQKDPAGVQSGMAYDTQYNSLLAFMEAIFKLVSLTYYVHDSALGLRNMILGKKIGDSGRQSVMGAITANFGNVSTASTIWNQFATALSKLASTTPEVQVSAFSPAMFPPVVPLAVHERQAGNNWSFLPHAVRISDFYTNAFFTAISVVHVQSAEYPEYPFKDGYVYQNAHLALIGNAVQVGPPPEGSSSPVYTSLPSVPEKSFYENSSDWASYPEGGGTDGTYDVINYSGAFVCGTCEPNYASVPEPSSNNHVRVVTGFKFVQLQSGGAFNAAIALQFGELDMSDLSNPVVIIDNPDFVSPDFTRQSDIQQFLVTNPVGDYSSGELRNGIMTSVRLAGHDVNNGPSCINVRMVPTFYMADFYQPTGLKPIITT